MDFRAMMKTPDPETFAQVMTAIGNALWSCQQFESLLGQFIVLLVKLPPDRAEKETLELIERMHGKTLGALITELRKGKNATAVSSFELRFDKFLDDRNWLVHRSWREHSNDLYDAARLPPLLARLDGISQESNQLQRALAGITERWMHDQGFTSEQIDAETIERLISQGLIRPTD